MMAGICDLVTESLARGEAANDSDDAELELSRAQTDRKVAYHKMKDCMLACYFLEVRRPQFADFFFSPASVTTDMEQT